MIYGPHRGRWIKVADGFVELVIFETSVPPRIQLYFFDIYGNPLLPKLSDDVSLEIIRSDGDKQVFMFEQQQNFLEATTMLPEPHEFEVILKIKYQGHMHNYVLNFTEHNHGNAHDHHEHKHAKGILSKFKGLFDHSHQLVDKIDESMETNELGIRTLKITLIILALTAFLQVIIVLISGSVALLADTIHNFADAATSIPLWIAFALARRGFTQKFTYGYGKTEDVAGVIIVLIILFSACIAAYESIIKIINPIPMENLVWVMLAAIIGFIGNEWVALYRIKIGKKIGSAALVADGYHARVDGFTSLAVALGVIGTWLGFPIMDPLVGMGITIAILLIVKDSVKSIGFRLIDGIEPDILSAIEHAPIHVEGVTKIQDVKARWIGHRVYAEVTIYVDQKLSVYEANQIAKKVEHALYDHVRLLGGTTVLIKPL